MTMNDRKMNNYSLMRISTVFVLAVALVTSTLAIPFVPRTGAEPLTPPNIPNTPDPADGSMNVLVSAVLSWKGGDPDNDTVKYDVYFGTSSSPLKVSSNQSNTSYDPIGNLAFNTTYHWQIVAWDNNNETSSGPLWVFTTVKGNNPPNIPNTPNPAHASINISITTNLTWIGGDPDNDTVKYDVYFGIISSPPKVSSNQSITSYNPLVDLANNTKYYWKIIAWDSNKTSAVGPLWYFTTKTGQEGPLTVTITKPLPGEVYLNDIDKMTLSGNNTIVYRGITIEANVTSDADVVKVEFWADGKLLATDNETPYSYFWRPIIQFNSAFSLKRTITVKAYDSDNNSASANITVTKWRFHPLPWIVAGLAIASRFVLHTTVVGMFYNVQQSRFSVSFYALRAHYKTVGPLQMRKGNLYFKHCTGGILIGPTTLTRMGPFHRFAIGSFTFIGNVNADKIGLGGSLLSRILQRRSG
ncbi:MAG: Ig-like domain-containing protein [Euryarchaeota archaeon]|nr:Ig-like domain-containing protein [Euryarchaeota archaeon]